MGGTRPCEADVGIARLGVILHALCLLVEEPVAGAPVCLRTALDLAKLPKLCGFGAGDLGGRAQNRLVLIGAVLRWRLPALFRKQLLQHIQQFIKFHAPRPPFFAGLHQAYLYKNQSSQAYLRVFSANFAEKVYILFLWEHALV